MSLGMSLQLSQRQVMKQALMFKCPLCSSEMELEEQQKVHNAYLGVDPVAALNQGDCPRCYSALKGSQPLEFSNALAEWMGNELEKKVPAWRQPFISPEMEPFRSIPWRLSFYSPALAAEYHAIGGCRGLFDYPSAEFQKSTLPRKRELLKKLKEYGISASEVRAACVRYLEVISKENYHSARAAIDLGWDEVFGSKVTKRLMKQAKELRELDRE